MKDGTISSPKIFKGYNPEFDRAAIDVVLKMPKWSPGIHLGKIVRSYYTIPVTIRRRH
ncbi:MAG: energy transducer TonB [Muribaculaceae bacterium]|nr:energy transducer TonB [Muribaculaceae bacterium]